MLPILVAGILSLVSVCAAWPSLINRPDAAFRANVLLIDTNPSASTLAQQIETAKSLISANQVRSKSVGKILHAFVGLEQMVQDAAQGKYTCEWDQIEKLAQIHQALRQFTTDGTYYLGRNVQRRLNMQVIDFQREFTKVCLKRFEENYAEVAKRLSRKMSYALDYLSILVVGPSKMLRRFERWWDDLVQSARLEDGKRVPNGKLGDMSRWEDVIIELKSLHDDDSSLRKVNPKTGQRELSVPEMKRYLHSLVEPVCSYYDDQFEASDILRKTDRLVGAVKPSYDLIRVMSTDFKQLSKHTIGLAACRDIKSLDIDDLAKQIAKEINKRR